MIKLRYYLLLLSLVLVAGACQSGGADDEQAEKLPNYDSLRSALLDSSRIKDSLSGMDTDGEQKSLVKRERRPKNGQFLSNGSDFIGDSDRVAHKVVKSQNLELSENGEGDISSEKAQIIKPQVENDKMDTLSRSDLLLQKGLTLERLREMGFLYVKLNTENLKSVHDMFDSGYMDTLAYEKTKLSIEKNLRIIRLLNQLSTEKGLQDKKFAVIYLNQFVGIVREGLITSQEVLQYLQRIYDTKKVSQQKYIVSANNLRVNVNLMWTIIRELDFK